MHFAKTHFSKKNYENFFSLGISWWTIKVDIIPYFAASYFHNKSLSDVAASSIWLLKVLDMRQKWIFAVNHLSFILSRFIFHLWNIWWCKFEWFSFLLRFFNTSFLIYIDCSIIISTFNLVSLIFLIAFFLCECLYYFVLWEIMKKL